MDGMGLAYVDGCVPHVMAAVGVMVGREEEEEKRSGWLRSALSDCRAQHRCPSLVGWRGKREGKEWAAHCNACSTDRC